MLKILTRFISKNKKHDSLALPCTTHTNSKTKDNYGDYKQWLICKKKGHISVNSFDDWLCLRCWTGYFMGMRYPIDEATQQAFKNPGLIVGNYTIAEVNGHLAYSKVYKENESPFIPDAKIITYTEALAKGPNTVAPDKGGPPYTYELKRI